MSETEYYAEIKSMVGVTMQSVERVKGNDSDELVFTSEDGRKFIFYYSQDCCASCDIEDIEGDLADLVGSPITLAEETSSSDVPPPASEGDYVPESYTWTFYHYGTAKGRVVVRWYGTSNGYYSEQASMRIEKP